jgi:hypothetical protein
LDGAGELVALDALAGRNDGRNVRVSPQALADDEPVVYVGLSSDQACVVVTDRFAKPEETA